MQHLHLTLRRFAAALAATLCFCILGGALRAEPASTPAPVTLFRSPDGGIQPQAAFDVRGGLHLIYFKGDPAAGDVMYTHRGAGETDFATPIRVNSEPGSVIATGTIRGAQIAVDDTGRVHIAWNGSNKATKGPGGNPMLYARLNNAGTAFEPQRNLITWAGGIDGGGTLAAGPGGAVYVLWHALAGARDEAGRAVFLALSTDGGKTFARERKINPSPTGACGCCSMKAFVDSRGALHVLYRAATEKVERGSVLLLSHDGGETFESQTLDSWPLVMCPMTSYAFAQAGTPVGERDGVRKAPVWAAWKNRDQLYLAALPARLSPAVALKTVSPTGTGDNRKYPTLATNSSGEMLLAWTEGTAWGRGGSVVWQCFSADGSLLGRPGRAPGVPTWSLVSAVTAPDGTFLLFY